MIFSFLSLERKLILDGFCNNFDNGRVMTAFSSPLNYELVIDRENQVTIIK
jgi:hypothetical protein